MTTTLYIIIAVEAVLLVAAAIYITYLIMRGRQAREMQRKCSKCRKTSSTGSWML